MPMILYLMRHGIAEEPTPTMADSERALTREGRRKTRAVAKGLLRMGVPPLPIVSSPFRRARETAVIVAGVLNGRPDVTLLPALQPGVPASSLIRWLQSRHESALFLVGHEPDLSRLAAALLTGEGTLNLAFKKAGVCAMEWSGHLRPGRARLLWFMPPRALRRLRRSNPDEDEE